MTDRSVGTHNPFREVESAMLCQHRLNGLCYEAPIFWVDERHVFRDGWRLAAGGEAIDLEQLGRPVVETGGIECPATGVREPLSLRQVELGLLAYLDVEGNPEPVQEGSIMRPEGFRATQEPAVHSCSAPNSESRLTGGAGA